MFKTDERYICAYLCNKNLMNEFNILINFYNEVAVVSLKTQNPQFMQIRIKWFMDALVNLYNGDKSGFPVLDNLYWLIREYSLEREDLISILRCRTLDKYYVPFKGPVEYINYCKNTGGVFWKLVMKIFGGDIKDQKAAYICGTVYAILGNIRNITFDSKNMIYKLVFDKKIILKGNDYIEKETQSNVLNLLNTITDYLKKINNIKVSKKCRRLLLLNIFNENYYKQLKESNGKYKNVKLYNLKLKYKCKFIFKYLFNI